MTTRLARTTVRMWLATFGPCWSSFGTVRKKNPRRVRSVVSVVRVAEPEMNASPPLLSGAVETCTSWLPAGPTTPRMARFDAKRSAT